MRLDGASPDDVRGAELLPGKSSYFIGNDPAKWRRDIPQFGRVEYRNVYPGVELVYYGNQRHLEYDFRVAPGADPGQIALDFQGASVRLDSGDLVLSTDGGDVRFHAPRVYQPALRTAGQGDANGETEIQGSFRQLAENKIGFALGPYDHSRELVIDPVLYYSTYFGGTNGAESLSQVAVDSDSNIYLAMSTTSTGLPAATGYQTILKGATNVFIAEINPFSSQLVYATYLGGSGTDDLAGLAVDTNFNIYVAGTTTSADFPTTPSAFEGPTAGTHGFVSQLTYSNTSGSVSYTLNYSTYLAGNGVDTVTGLAIDSAQDAYVTGATTSTNVGSGFPSTPSAYQPCPWGPLQAGGACPTVTNPPPQFFASKINTAGTGAQSMIYSTYYGGSYTNDPNNVVVTGGGIAVDPPPSASINMYFTGSTNMPGVAGPNQGQYPFPLINAYQSCLDQPGQTSCTPGFTPTAPDAFLVKLLPEAGQVPSYATFLGGSGNDAGLGVAVDTLGNAYVTGSTTSSDWVCTSPCVSGPFSYDNNGGVTGVTNAFVAKLTDNFLSFFGYIGGSGPDIGQAVAVDSVQTVHVAGTTSSSNPQLPVTNELQTYQGQNGASNAFVALLPTTPSSTNTGYYLSYLGGSGPDQGTGLAIDAAAANTYVAGTTESSPAVCTSPCAGPSLAGFPITLGAYQVQQNGSVPNAFVSKIGNSSSISIATGSGSPSPNPVPAGTQATFTFDLTNNGPDPATNVTFYAMVPTGFPVSPTAQVSSGQGSCSGLPPGGNTIVCLIQTLSVGAEAQVQVFVTPPIPAPTPPSISVSANVGANGQQAICPPHSTCSQTDPISDFTITATSPAPINAGDLAQITVTFAPANTLGYSGTITPSQSTSPPMVTSPSPTFNPTTVILPGSGSGGSATTVLSIQTVARPVTTGSLFRQGPFYATWLPIGGLSLVGLGLGASRKRRRWLIAAALVLLAGIIVLQPACSSGSSATTTTGGTLPGQYAITITGSAGTGAAHNTVVTLIVH
jgi:uncharacterized repeat protein (TIGR01451 family)